MEVLDAKTAYNFLRMRRSIRNFTPELVSEEKMKLLLDIARYAPTAANSQDCTILVSDRELIKKRSPTVWLTGCRKKIDNNSPRRRYFRKVLKSIGIGA